MDRNDLIDIWRIRNPMKKDIHGDKNTPIYNVDLIPF